MKMNFPNRNIWLGGIWVAIPLLLLGVGVGLFWEWLKPKGKDWHDAFASSTWSSWALVIVGIGAIIAALLTLRTLSEQTLATKESADAASDAAKAAKESIILTHRPKLIARNVVVPGLEALHLQTSVADLIYLQGIGTIEGHFQLANVGNTTATINSISEEILIQFGLPMERKYSGTKSLNIELAPGEARAIPLTPVEFNELKQGLVMNPQMNVYVMGLIKYTDKLGISRETAFCRILDRRLKRFVLVTDQDYEYAD